MKSNEKADKVLFSIKHLQKKYLRSQGSSEMVLNNVSLELIEEEVTGIIGLSGAGKTTLLRCILQLTRPDEGEVWFRGAELTKLTEEELRLRLRPAVRMIYQHPEAALNPGLTVGDIFRQALELNRENLTDNQIKERCLSLIGDIGLNETYLQKYPHQLSGGEKRRVALARALATGPEVLFADEPFAGLDKVLQFAMLRLILKIKKKYRLTVVIISHDTDIMREICDTLIVMHEGRIVEVISKPWAADSYQHEVSKKLLDV